MFSIVLLFASLIHKSDIYLVSRGPRVEVLPSEML